MLAFGSFTETGTSRLCVGRQRSLPRKREFEIVVGVLGRASSQQKLIRVRTFGIYTSHLLQSCHSQAGRSTPGQAHVRNVVWGWPPVVGIHSHFVELGSNEYFALEIYRLHQLSNPITMSIVWSPRLLVFVYCDI